MSATWITRITSIGTARSSSSHSFSDMSAIARKSDSAIVPISSTLRCSMVRPRVTVGGVAQDRGDDHGANVGRQRHVSRKPAAQQAACPHRDEHDGHHLQQGVGGGWLPGRLDVDVLVERRVLRGDLAAAWAHGPSTSARMKAPDEPGRNRSANQPAADQPECRRGHRERAHRREAVLVFHQLAERRARAVPAGHRDRAGDQAEEGMHAERSGREHPTPYWRAASTEASTQKISTWGPPTRSSPRLAPRPMLVKNAIMSGVWSVVSNSNATTPVSRRASATAANRKPPTTGAGML